MLHVRNFFEARYYKCIDIVFNQRDNVFPRQLVIRQSFSPRDKIFTSTLIQPTLFILSGISLEYQCLCVSKKKKLQSQRFPENQSIIFLSLPNLQWEERGRKIHLL